MKLLNFTIIKLLIYLVIGILIGYFFNTKLLNLLIVNAIGVCGLIFSYIRSRKQFHKTGWFGIFSFITMINIGILTTQIHNEKNFSNHYTHTLSSNTDSTHTISFRIKETLKPSVYYNKYIVEILKLDEQEARGKVLLNLKKDTIASEVNIDDIFVCRTLFNSIPEPLNPYQFNYKSYLSQHYVYHQITLESNTNLKVKSTKTTLLGLAASIRHHLNAQLKQYNFKPDQLAIINALFLGQREDINNDVYSNYINAGAVHILAVSGLHVGIILMLFNLILKPIEFIKNGKVIKTILLVTLLWCFAIIAGLSASVTRAVTMFSIISIAMNLKRPTNIYNTLAISMFILLLFKPLFIFDIGFQLSYLAVISIVSIESLLYRLWQPKNKIIDLYWHTLTVTTAAQIGIFPLSLYYFHQFPGLFFVSNLVIVPILGCVLGFGILVIFLGSCGILPNFIADLFGNTISVMNSFVAWVSQQDLFIFKNIPFGNLHLIAAYLLILSGFIFMMKKQFKSVLILLCSIICLQITWIYLKWQPVSNELVIFHKNRHSLIGHTEKNALLISHDFDSITAHKDQVITNYLLGKQITDLYHVPLKQVYPIKTKHLLVVDSLGIYDIPERHPEYILLRQSPRINLNRLIETLSPKYIIADGSNYTSYIQNWEMVCRNKKLPFHYTGKKGAFTIEF